MRLTFHEVYFRMSKRGICAGCGKSAERTEKFFQTINPYNRNAAGIPKSSKEIMDELKQEAVVWRQKPVCHARCESLVKDKQVSV